MTTRDGADGGRMSEHQILMSGPMVRALLAGTKTQTRRVVRPQPPDSFHRNAVQLARADDEDDTLFAVGPDGWEVRCPFGDQGDRLWVRETWSHDGPDLAAVRARHQDMLRGGITYGPYYRATETAPETLRWIPSIHMPRWASRITLEIVSVRVERVQEISEADAKAEGCEPKPGTYTADFAPGYVAAYRDLWGSLNAKRAPWSSNPWVWVVEFKVLTGDA